MSGQDETRYSLWFQRVGRGIALVGPTLLLLIILATFVTRLGERAGGPERDPAAGAPAPAAAPSSEDAPTTTVPDVPMPEAPPQ